MSAPVAVTSETIKALVVIFGGVREAARQLGLDENMVLQRSRREKWMDDPAVAEACRKGRNATGPGSRSPAVMAPISPAAALAAEMSSLAGQSRIKLARGLHKAAGNIETMEGKDVLERASDVKQTAQSLALVHGWQNSAPMFKIDLSITSDRSGPPPATVEAEWRDADAELDETKWFE